MHRITIMPQGWQFDAPDGQTLLKSAEAAGIRLPSSCRNGTCRTCFCHSGGGTVRYLIEWPGLSFDEKREGYVLPCVAVPESELTLFAPAARRN